MLETRLAYLSGFFTVVDVFLAYVHMIGVPLLDALVLTLAFLFLVSVPLAVTWLVFEAPQRAESPVEQEDQRFEIPEIVPRETAGDVDADSVFHVKHTF